MQLLIVDDHYHLIEEMLVAIPWEELGIKNIHTAVSSLGALEILKDHSIDLIITDIRMPGMNGLELLEQVNDHYEHVHSIVLSGYDDFEYAKTAMRFGVEEYLVKPVRDQDVIDAVKRIAEKIKLKWEEDSSRQKALYTLRANLPYMRAKLLNEMLQGKKISEETLSIHMQQYDLMFLPSDNISLMMIRLDDDMSEYSLADTTLIEYGISNIAEEILSEQLFTWQCRNHYGYLIFAVSFKNQESAACQDVNNRILLMEQYSNRIQSNVAGYLKKTISVYVSTWGQLADLTELYRGSMINILKKFGGRSSFIHVESELDGTSLPVHVDFRTVFDPPSIQQLLELGSWDEAEQKIRAQIQEFSFDQEKMLGLYFVYSSALVFMCQKHQISIVDVLGEEIERLLSPQLISSPKYLTDWSFRTLRNLRKILEVVDQSGSNQIIRQIQKYVEDHLTEDLSLKTIADHIFVHPVYVSRVYKSETGELLSDYIIRKRMDKAAYLLKNTNQKIYEISSLLGYQNSNYFARTFKKQFGVTPIEYRNL